MKRRVLAAGIAALAIAGSVMIATVSAATADPLTSGVRGGPTPNSDLPAAIRIDDPQLKVVEMLRGVGKQVYDCKGGTYAFREPIAGLFKAQGLPLPAAIHGAGPFWADFDGSKVVGSSTIDPVKAFVPADNKTDIPWLKVTAGTNAGTGGVFSNVKFIQRTDTHGGVAPASCTEPSTVSVDYTAFYVFWGPR